MGMDYRWSGSSSYPRFDRELCAIAAIFGGIKTDHLKERESTEGKWNFCPQCGARMSVGRKR